MEDFENFFNKATSNSLLDSQKLLFEAVEQNKNLICLKSRHIGATTFLLVYIFYLLLKRELFFVVLKLKLGIKYILS